MIKILLVDDQMILAEGIKSVLETCNDFLVCGIATDGAEAVSLVEKVKPDLVLMDITMPNMDGLEALRAIRAADGNANVVMCSAMGQETMVIDAIRSGAKDFIVKPFKIERVLKTVTSIVGEP